MHVGCGSHILPGWINVDLKGRPGVDLALDVRQGLPYSGLEAVYAEHFLEHLTIVEALGFLGDVHRALAPGGRLRLSTPNLDWVWVTQYRLEGDEDARRQMAIQTNRGFYGWQHRFLWNREMLAEALASTGYDDLCWCRYGESPREIFRGIEGHETYEDDERTPHVLVVEARKGEPQAERLAALRARLQRDLLDHLEG